MIFAIIEIFIKPVTYILVVQSVIDLGVQKQNPVAH